LSLRLLQVNKAYFPHIGGVEHVVAQLAEGLSARGRFEVRVLACAERGTGSSEVINGVLVEKAATLAWVMSMPVSTDFMRRFRRNAGDCDLILLHHPFPLGFLAAQLSQNKKPISVWYHADVVRQRMAGRLLTPLWHAVLGRAKRIFVSDRQLAERSKVLSRYRSKCVAVPFGIDLRRFEDTPEVRSAASEIRRRYGTPLVLSVGRFVYYKGFEYLIEAMRYVDAKLLLVGSGPLEARLRALAAAHGVDDKVHIIDSVRWLTPYYHACDIFVLPSVERAESFGLVQLEAMACGKPVINTWLPTAVPTVSLNNVTGLTVAPRSSVGLAEAINRLLGDEALRARLGANALQRAAEHYSLERFIAAVERELSAACSSS